MILWLRSPGINIPEDWPSPGQYLEIKTTNHVFDETAIAIGARLNITGRGTPEQIEGIRVSSAFLPMLGAKPVLGRLFVQEEDVPGKTRTVVLTHGLWTRMFGADPGVIGRTLVMNGNDFSIAGVLGPDFHLTREVVPTV